MANWTKEPQPFGANHTPLLTGLSSTDGETPVPVAVDPATGALITEGGGGSGGGTSSTFGATFPTTGTAVGATNGTDMEPLQVDGSGYLEVNVETSALPTGAATAANQATMITDLGLVSTSSNQTNGTQQTKLTNGTNIADVVAGDTGFNGVATASATKTYTFTTSTSGAQTLLANTPTEGFAIVEVVYTSVGVGLALAGQFSATSGGTYVNNSTFENGGTNAGVTPLGAVLGTTYTSTVRGNYFQIAVSALTSGTFTGTVTLRAAPISQRSMAAVQTGTWTVGSNSATGSAVPANAFYIAGTNGGNLTGIGVGAVGDSSSTGNVGVYANARMEVYNGTSQDMARSATAANNTTGTGLLGVAELEWDGTNYQRIPSARFAPSTTKLNTNSYHITTNTTNTPTASTAYISSIAISAEVGGTTSSITIQDKQGTPLKLVNGLSTTAVTTAPTIISFHTPVLMTSGIDIITAGAVAGTVDVWINWFQ